MKRIVLLFFTLIALLTANCAKEEKTAADIPESVLVEAYVQISLIYESERGLAEKDARVANYLVKNNLSKQKIDRMLDKYKSNPNEWRGFFMKVQSRLRELEAQQLSRIVDDDSIKVVETEEQITVESDLAAVVDTLITGSIESDIAKKTIVEGSLAPDSSQQLIDLTVVPADNEEVENVNTTTPLKEKDDEGVQNIKETNLTEVEEGLGFVSYKVQPGDNLSTLAKENDSEMAQLMLVNSLEDANSIKIGQTLFLPNKSTMILLHTISSGEALSKISANYNSDLELLVKINKIDDVNSIKAGDFLYIPVLKGEKIIK